VDVLTSPCCLVPLALGTAHVTYKQDCLRKLWHSVFISGLLLQSIETALFVLHTCVSQAKSPNLCIEVD